MLHWLWTAFSTYVLHSEHGNGYQWHSGIGSVYTPKDAIYIGAIVKYAHVRNCHHPGCWSVHTHNHPEHGWPACKRHWDEVPEHVVATS